MSILNSLLEYVMPQSQLPPAETYYFKRDRGDLVKLAVRQQVNNLKMMGYKDELIIKKLKKVFEPDAIRYAKKYIEKNFVMEEGEKNMKKRLTRKVRKSKLREAFEVGDKVKIDPAYGGGEGVISDEPAREYYTVNGKYYHESDLELIASAGEYDDDDEMEEGGYGKKKKSYEQVESDQYFEGQIENPRRLTNYVEGKHGFTVLQQLENVLAGEPYAEQNYQALKMIRSAAKQVGEEDLAFSLSDYLGIIEGKGKKYGMKEQADGYTKVIVDNEAAYEYITNNFDVTWEDDMMMVSTDDIDRMEDHLMSHGYEPGIDYKIVAEESVGRVKSFEGFKKAIKESCHDDDSWKIIEVYSRISPKNKKQFRKLSVNEMARIANNLITKKPLNEGINELKRLAGL